VTSSAKQQNDKRLFTWRWMALILGFWAALYLPNLGLHELRDNEAVRALMAREMCLGKAPLRTSVNGEHVDVFPLYSWLVSLTGCGRWINPWTARLPATLAILLMALMAAAVARAAGAERGGATVAAGFVLTVYVSLREGTRAGNDAVFALLISAAWLSWYALGRNRRNWNAAWLVGLTLTALAMFAGGAKAIVLFYLPLVLLQRPVRPLRRMLMPGHIVGITGLLGIVLLWRVLCPDQVFFPWSALVLRSVPQNTGTYLGQFLLFPLKCCAYILPWPLFCWPAFCVAFRQFESDGVFCRFLRALVLCLVLPAWLLPDVSPRALLPLVCPLAILTGIHYQILERRYLALLRRLAGFLLGLVFTAAPAGLIIALLHACRVIVFENSSWALWLAWTIPFTTVLALALIVNHAGRRLSFPLQLLILLTALRLIDLGVGPPAYAWRHNEGVRRAAVLGAQLPAGQSPVYLLADRLLVIESFYLPSRCVRIRTAAELPPDHETVFVIGDRRPPILETRTWSTISQPVRMHRRVRHDLLFGHSGGILNQARIRVLQDADQDDAVVRLHRGDLRPPVE